jgi:hypothetical protein
MTTEAGGEGRLQQPRSRTMSEADANDPSRGNVAIRIDKETVARLDALAPHVSTPGRRATRSDTLRSVIMLGLRVAEIDPKTLSLPFNNPKKPPKE